MDTEMFWATLSAAIATLVAALVALFLRELRAWWRPPKLELCLSLKSGAAVTAYLFPSGQGGSVEYRPEKSRYYHLRVSNPRRKADSVQGVTVTLLRVQRKGADGHYHHAWSGDIPMAWRNDMSALGERKVVGTWAESDLCSVIRDKFLDLHIKVFPNDLKWRYEIGGDTPVDIIVTVQARGNEVDSEEYRLRIFWDGEWQDGDVEMRQHFHVTMI